MDDDDLLAACQQKMATPALRPGQGDVVRHLQRNEPCLAIMPTGGGKSLLWLLTTYIQNLKFKPQSGQKPLTLVVVPYKALVLSHLHESAPWFPCDEHKVLVAEVAKAHSGQQSKTTSFFFEDVTYAYSDHYAMSFLTESLVTGRGAVAAFVLITRLHTEAYAFAFYTFMTENACLYYIDPAKRIIVLMFVLVVDHADSQRKGFIEAVKMLHVTLRLETPWTQELADSYLENLQGCEFHYAYSVKNTARNGTVIPNTRIAEFKGLCKAMLTTTSNQS